MEAEYRKLGIPTVVDRVIQQAISQQLQPLFEPLFSEGSYGYRPGRSAQQAIQSVKAYAEQGYGYAVEIDLSKYFDTLNHELLMNLLRKQIHDKRVTDLISISKAVSWKTEYDAKPKKDHHKAARYRRCWPIFI